MNAMVLVLVAACIVSLAIKSWIEGGVIAGAFMISCPPNWVAYQTDHQASCW